MRSAACQALAGCPARLQALNLPQPRQLGGQLKAKAAAAPLRRSTSGAAMRASGVTRSSASGGGGAFISPATKARILDLVNEELAGRLAAQCGLPVDHVPGIKRAIAATSEDAQAALRQHGLDVAAHLAQQGVPKEELALLLEHPYGMSLMARPVSEAADMLASHSVSVGAPAAAADGAAQSKEGCRACSTVPSAGCVMAGG